MRHVSLIRQLFVATFLGSVATAQIMPVYAKEVVSNKMAVPLKKAEQFLKQGKLAQASEALKEAQSIPSPSVYEQHIIDQMAVSLAIKQNNVDAAVAGYNKLLAAKDLTSADRQNMTMAQASLTYRAKQYSKTIQYVQNYFKVGGTNPRMTTLLIQSYFLNNNYKEAMDAQQKQIDQEIKNGKIPAESQWQIMANCQEKLGDKDGLRHSYTQLAIHYSKPEYWSHVMAALVSTPGMNPQTQLEVKRFQLDTGLVKTADQYVAMAEIAVQAGLPHMAKNLMAKGQQKKLFVEKDADRAVRFSQFIDEQIKKEQPELPAKIEAAKKDPNGDALFTLGYDAFCAGKIAEGMSMMKEALAKPMQDHSLASLQFAMAELSMGDKTKAITTLKTIQGKGVPVELASLWLMKLQVK